MKENKIHDMWPQNGLEGVESCPVCGSGERNLLHSDLTDRVFFCAPGKWSLYKCSNCGSAYLDPRPTTDTIHLAYSNYYTHTPPNKKSSNNLGRLRRIRKSMANGYRNWKYGTEYTPANKLGIPVAFLAPGLRHRLEEGFRNISKAKPGERLLDVGSGNGEFLEIAQDMGYETYGVDPDPKAVESAVSRGLNVRLGGIEEYEDMLETFDVITMNHVIEHVHDPYKILLTVYRLLKPGGLLWLSTPNIMSFGYKKYKHNWRGLEPPRHLHIFNWDSLINLLKKSGFNSIEKIINNKNYPNLAEKSSALSKGIDPYSLTKISIKYRLKGLLIGVRTYVNYHRTEFITLKAYKNSNGS